MNYKKAICNFHIFMKTQMLFNDNGTSCLFFPSSVPETCRAVQQERYMSRFIFIGLSFFVIVVFFCTPLPFSSGRSHLSKCSRTFSDSRMEGFIFGGKGSRQVLVVICPESHGISDNVLS